MIRQTTSLAKRQGIIFILSAPSGAGKTTLYNELKRIHPEIRLSVSCTTRARRPGELNGRDYRFLSEPAFRRSKSAESSRSGPRSMTTITARPKNRWIKASERDAIFSSTLTFKARTKSSKLTRKPCRSFFCRRR